MCKYQTILLFMVLILSSWATAATGEPEPTGKARTPTTYTLKTSVVGSAGGQGTSANFSTIGILGQPGPIGSGAGGEQRLYSGFCYSFQRLAWLTHVALPELLTNELNQNYPNPFNPATTIEYVVATKSLVTISIFDVRGRKLRSLVRENQSPGRHKAVWDGRDDRGRQVSSGLYLCRMNTGEFNSVVKMLMLK